MAFSLKQKTQFYHQLYAGHNAGVPLQQLLSGGALPSAFSRYSARLLADVEKGMPLSKALSDSQIVTAWEASLLSIGEASGRLDAVLAELETFFHTRNKQLGAIKTRMVYPLLVVFIAITVLPLPELARGAVTTSGYLVTVCFKLLVVWLCYQFFLVMPFERATSGAVNPWLIKLSRHLNDEHWLRLTFEIGYLNLLTLCLESGLDAGEALTLFKDATQDKRWRHQQSLAASLVRGKGVALTSALMEAGILKNPQVLSFLFASERSGTLHSDMRSYLKRMKGEVANLVDWHIKRYSNYLYVLLMVWAGLRAFGYNPFMPSV